MFEIPPDAVEKVAQEIRRRTTKDYKLPVVGTPENLETPQIFEIIPFDAIDALPCRSSPSMEVTITTLITTA